MLFEPKVDWRSVIQNMFFAYPESLNQLCLCVDNEQSKVNTLLVGGFNLSEKYQSIGMISPNIWKTKKCSSHHQPALSCIEHFFLKMIKQNIAHGISLTFHFELPTGSLPNQQGHLK